MRHHLVALPGGLVDTHDPAYWRYPVHSRSTPTLEAHFATEGEPPRLAQLAVSVLAEAVKRNDRNAPGVGNALEALGAFFSTAAGDDAPALGIPRPFTGDSA